MIIFSFILCLNQMDIGSSSPQDVSSFVCTSAEAGMSVGLPWYVFALRE